MALTDGSYIARRKLNRLDQPYQAGDVVPGSAFRDSDQIAEYIQRGRVDVDNSGTADSGASVTGPVPTSLFRKINQQVGNYADDYIEFTDANDGPGGAAGVLLSDNIIVEVVESGLFQIDISFKVQALEPEDASSGGRIVSCILDIWSPGVDPATWDWGWGDIWVASINSPQWGYVPNPSPDNPGDYRQQSRSGVAYIPAGSKIQTMASSGFKGAIKVDAHLALTKIA